nr:guanylate-binding protein 3-like [Anolis sagrei ordinatus]
MPQLHCDAGQSLAFPFFIWGDYPPLPLGTGSHWQFVRPKAKRVLAKLAETYVETICSGKVPCLESAVLVLAEMENTAAMEEAVAHYGKLMEERLSLPTESVPELLGVHAECEKEALQVFMARAFKDDKSHFQAKLMKTLDDRKEEYCRRNEQESIKRCQALLATLCVELEEKERGQILWPFLAVLLSNASPIHAEAALKQFLEDKEDVGRAILQSDKALSEKEKQMAEAQVRKEAAQREQEVLRQRQAEREQKMQDRQRSSKENVRQLKAKMEQHREQLLKEQEKMVESKLAEQEALLKEGFQKKAGQVMKEVQRLKVESATIRDPSWLDRVLKGLVSALIFYLPEIVDKVMEVVSNLFRLL